MELDSVWVVISFAYKEAVTNQSCMEGRANRGMIVPPVPLDSHSDCSYLSTSLVRITPRSHGQSPQGKAFLTNPADLISDHLGAPGLWISMGSVCSWDLCVFGIYMFKGSMLSCDLCVPGISVFFGSVCSLDPVCSLDLCVPRICVFLGSVCSCSNPSKSKSRYSQYGPIWGEKRRSGGFVRLSHFLSQVGPRQPNLLCECFWNKEAAHGRPKSLMPPEALKAQPIMWRYRTATEKYLPNKHLGYSSIFMNVFISQLNDLFVCILEWER